MTVWVTEGGSNGVRRAAATKSTLQRAHRDGQAEGRIVFNYQRDGVAPARCWTRIAS